MKILIEFPYNTHWRTKDKFKNDFALFYPKDINGKEDKSAVILPYSGRHGNYVMFFICKIRDYFPFVDVWDLNIPDKNDRFTQHNFINFVLTPKRVMQDYGGITLDHA